MDTSYKHYDKYITNSSKNQDMHIFVDRTCAATLPLGKNKLQLMVNPLGNQHF